ncbi:MAG: hypothetical protein QG657_5856 [Acidobacteriota bacterium]|nr:hypothetical protein [Acidobacteriota bacterium]
MDLAGIGSRLKNIRKKLDFTQKEFAEILAITMVTLSDIETGKKQPGSDLLFNLAKSFEVNLDFLLFGRGCKFREGAEVKGVMIEDNSFGENTDDVREMLWYMQNSRLAQNAFITLTKEYIYRNWVILRKDINLQNNKNEQENKNE